jgi:hypothetical protein
LPALTKASRIPLGESGEKLHDWAFATRTFRAVHGVEGGATGPDDDIAAEYFQNIGATIMGRHMFGGDGPWGDNPWNGWWGENPPFHMPVFVLTHYARDFDAAVARAEEMQIEMVLPRHRNPPSGDGGPNHWECWLRDPDGYTVVLASPDGSADGSWRPTANP